MGKIQVIKELRTEFPALSLRQCKDMVDTMYRTAGAECRIAERDRHLLAAETEFYRNVTILQQQYLDGYITAADFRARVFELNMETFDKVGAIHENYA